MTRKYFCDNCGEKLDDETKVCHIEFRTYKNGELCDYTVFANSEGEPADFCQTCREKIQKIIREGFQ